MMQQNLLKKILENLKARFSNNKLIEELKIFDPNQFLFQMVSVQHV